MESRGLSESGVSLWFCGGLMVEKSRRSAETLGLLDANDGVSRWHFHEHLVLLQLFFRGKIRYSNSKEKWAFFFTQTEKAKKTLKELSLGRNPTVVGFVVSIKSNGSGLFFLVSF